MTLDRLWQLVNDASSQAAELKEHYDFAGEVGPDIVRKLLIEREELIGAIDRVLSSSRFRTDSPTFIILRDVRIKSELAWPKVDPEPFNL